MNLKLVSSVDDRLPIAEPKTHTERAYLLMREAILKGALEPGTKLQTESLKKQYEFSGTTIREALTRLVGDALVTSEGQRGFRVAPVSLGDFKDLCEVRKTIEVEALRKSIGKGDDRWEGEVVAAYHRLAKVEDRLPLLIDGLYEEWEVRNADFHRALISACPSRWLLRIYDQLFQQAERYRRITFASRKNLPRNVQLEHKAIMEATVARDVDAACGLAASHILKTLSVFEKILETL